jgi:hypothetical protein
MSAEVTPGAQDAAARPVSWATAAASTPSPSATRPTSAVVAISAAPSSDEAERAR